MKKLILISALLFSFNCLGEASISYGSEEKPIGGVEITQNIGYWANYPPYDSSGCPRHSIKCFWVSEERLTYRSNNEGKFIINSETSKSFKIEASYSEIGAGNISVQDALYILQHLVELRDLNADQIKAADINGDGNITIQDALKVLQHNVELVTIDQGLIFYDKNTGNLLSETVFDPGDTPSISAAILGDVNESFDPGLWVNLGSNILGEQVFQSWEGSKQVVSINEDGNRIAIGSNNNDGDIYIIPGGCNCVKTRLSESGHVRIFEFDGNSWAQLGSDIQGEGREDFMPTSENSLSLNQAGDILAVGSTQNDGDTKEPHQLSSHDSGHARIFKWDNSSWTQMGEDIDGLNGRDYAGVIDLDDAGDTIVIGARGDCVPGCSSSSDNVGSLRVLDWNGTDWIQRGEKIYGINKEDATGESLSLSGDGNTVITGSGTNDEIAENSGNARVFAWNGTSWLQKGNDIYGEEANDILGWRNIISSDGDKLFFKYGGKVKEGAWINNKLSMFSWEDKAWVKKNNFELYRCASDITNQSFSDNNSFAILQPSDSGSFCSNYSYTIEIYDLVGNNFVQRGGSIPFVKSVNGSSSSLSMSRDGKVITITDDNSTINGGKTGHVTVYRWTD